MEQCDPIAGVLGVIDDDVFDVLAGMDTHALFTGAIERSDVPGVLRVCFTGFGDAIPFGELFNINRPSVQFRDRTVQESDNSLRTSFDGNPVDDIDPETVREDIESPAAAMSTQALQRERPQEQLERFADWVENMHADLPEQINQLEALIEEYKEQEASELTASKLELLELGEEVIESESDVCPLCAQV